MEREPAGNNNSGAAIDAIPNDHVKTFHDSEPPYELCTQNAQLIACRCHQSSAHNLHQKQRLFVYSFRGMFASFLG